MFLGQQSMRNIMVLIKCIFGKYKNEVGAILPHVPLVLFCLSFVHHAFKWNILGAMWCLVLHTWEYVVLLVLRDFSLINASIFSFHVFFSFNLAHVTFLVMLSHGMGFFSLFALVFISCHSSILFASLKLLRCQPLSTLFRLRNHVSLFYRCIAFFDHHIMQCHVACHLH